MRAFFTVNAVNIRGGLVGSPAMLTCELGQVRKEAAAAGKVCAGVLSARSPPRSTMVF